MVVSKPLSYLAENLQLMPTSKNKTSLIGVPWNISQIWNETLDRPVARPLVPRDYIYASEIGKSLCDRYLKMYGVTPTNPPNTRSLRKFQAGDSWEFITGMMLSAAGMLKKQQIRVEVKLPKLLRVSGRLDFVVGAPADYNAAKENIRKMQEQMELIGWSLPPFFFNAIDKFIDKYKGQKLIDVIAEIKTVSSFMMEKIQKTASPMPHHVFQNFHYVYGNDAGITTGKLLYVCKDDCIMEEFLVENNEELLQQYILDVKKITKAYKVGFNPKNPLELMPEKEPAVLFEEGVWRFAKNWNVEYSDYLTLLHGYATPEAYRMAWQYKTSSWNRVFKRCLRNDRMTDKNKEVIADALKHFPNWDKLVAKAKAAGAFASNDEETEEEN